MRRMWQQFSSGILMCFQDQDPLSFTLWSRCLSLLLSSLSFHCFSFLLFDDLCSGVIHFFLMLPFRSLLEKRVKSVLLNSTRCLVTGVVTAGRCHFFSFTAFHFLSLRLSSLDSFLNICREEGKGPIRKGFLQCEANV